MARPSGDGSRSWLECPGTGSELACVRASSRDDLEGSSELTRERWLETAFPSRSPRGRNPAGRMWSSSVSSASEGEALPSVSLCDKRSRETPFGACFRLEALLPLLSSPELALLDLRPKNPACSVRRIRSRWR